MKRILLVLIAITTIFPLNAQQMNSARDTSFKASQLIAPGVLITSGTIIHCFAHDSIDPWFRDKALSLRGNYYTIDDYIRWLPAIADLGLGLIGVPADKGMIDRSIEFALAATSMIIITRGCKNLISSQRPNGGDFKSFPSGHTASVFMGAELVRMEYGPWWGAGAYLVAGSVGALRMYNNRHWFSDVLAGAGVGILTAHIGEWLLEPTKRLLKIPDSDWGNGRKVQTSIVPSIDTLTGTPCVGLALKF